MNNTPDASANDTGGTGLRHEIAALSTGIAEARREISAGNVIDLSGFLSKVRDLCAAITANPPADAAAPMIMSSIEKLVEDLNELGREMTELEAGNAGSGSETEGDGT